MSQFSNLVETHGESLLQQWVSRVQHGHNAASSSPAQLRDELGPLLTSLTAALRRGSPLGITAAANALETPPRRLASDALREYALFGDALLELAEQSGATPSLAEMRVLTSFVAGIIANCAIADAGAQQRRAHFRGESTAGEVERMQDLFMHAPVPFAIVEGADLTFTFANSAYRATIGGRAVVGRALLQALPELGGQGFDTLLTNVMSSGQAYLGTETPVQLAGSPVDTPRYFNFLYQPRRNSDGVVNSVMILGTDVTAQVHARKSVERQSEALRQSEQRLRRVVEATGAGMWELDLVTQQVTADAHLRALHGFPAEGPVDLEAAFASAHPADQERLREATEAALDPKGSRHYQIEYRVADASGHYRWVEARGHTYFDAAGVPSLLLGTALDVTARKEAELGREGLLAALRAQQLMQVCVLEGPQHIVTMVNELYRRNVAGGRDIVGMPVLDAFPELAGQGFDVLMNQVLAKGEPYIGHEVPTRLALSTGVTEERFFSFLIQPVRGRHGTVDSLLNLSHDVTHFVQSRRVLESSARQEKERAAFERQLIGIVSHDLRNPLAAIRMGVGLLLSREDLGPTSRKTVLRIGNTLERMVRLVNDLLDFTQARLGSGLPMVRAPMDLHAVVRQVVEELQITFADREIRLEEQGDGRGVWDRDRLAQASLNLITNALKYSPPDAAIAVHSRGVGDRVELQIWNPGEPIAPDLLPHLFEPMQRGSAQAGAGSVGLGLFIVKHIVDALDGTISVTSTADAGTTFTLSLPRASARR